MDINLTTPALLIPAVSLLLLAYTNRFLALASTIRKLHAEYKASSEPSYLKQIEKLRLRIRLVRNMQASGVLSLFLCMLCMFSLFFGMLILAKVIFAVSMLVVMASLSFSLLEINISVHALDMHLQDLQKPGRMEG